MVHRAPSKSPRRKGDVAELLRQALAQPGIRAVMQVYRSWDAVEKAARPYSQVMQDKPLITASDSSGTPSW
jgi:hypothetical protein